MGPGWNNDKELVFLHEYQKEPILWDPKHPHYKDRSEVYDGWVRIGQKLDVSVLELKRKKDSLMATYRAHRRKIKAASDSDRNYKPIWFAFEFMDSFLGAELDGSRSRNHVQEMENILLGVKQEPIETSEPEPAPPRKRPRKESPELQERETSASNSRHVFNTKNIEDEDECDLYAKILAKKLRKLPERDRMYMMYEIDGLFLQQLPKKVSVAPSSSSPTMESRPSSALSSYSEHIYSSIKGESSNSDTSECLKKPNISITCEEFAKFLNQTNHTSCDHKSLE